MHNIIYRGYFETARVAFIVEAATRAYGPAKFWWLSPIPLTATVVGDVTGFVSRREELIDYEFLDGRYSAIHLSRPRISRGIRGSESVSIIGTDTLEWVAGARAARTVWYVNGIPDERAMAPRIKDRGIVWAKWVAHRVGQKPSLTVTVSSRMSQHFVERVGLDPDAVFVAPCCVDRSTHRNLRPWGEREAVVCYMGSGAPWQAIELTAKVWSEAACMRPDLRFLVVSRDSRTDELLTGPCVRGDRVSVSSPVAVSSTLQQARVGTLLREDHIVNRVSFPTKLGEYLASGVPVLASGIPWDVVSYVEESRAGCLVSPGSDPEGQARQLLSLVDREPAEVERSVNGAAQLLDKDRWVELLVGRLLRVAERAVK